MSGGGNRKIRRGYKKGEKESVIFMTATPNSELWRNQRPCDLHKNDLFKSKICRNQELKQVNTEIAAMFFFLCVIYI